MNTFTFNGWIPDLMRWIRSNDDSIYCQFSYPAYVNMDKKYENKAYYNGVELKNGDILARIGINNYELTFKA